jgi:two-component system LytT family response regulator
VIRVLIVDDEPLARRGVKYCLKREPDTVIAGEAENATQAMAQIEALKPDLLFLDVQMPGLSGFDLLERIPPHERPFVIFLTAHESYAIRAFSEHPVDYLLKPIDDERFRAAFQCARVRIRERAAAAKGATGNGDAPSYLNHFIVRIGERRLLIPVNEVGLIRANHDYVTLHCGTRTYLLRDTISSLGGELDPQLFCRIHRSAIVAVNHVREVRSLESGDFTMRLADGSELRASRRYRDQIRGLWSARNVTRS